MGRGGGVEREETFVVAVFGGDADVEDSDGGEELVWGICWGRGEEMLFARYTHENEAETEGVEELLLHRCVEGGDQQSRRGGRCDAGVDVIRGRSKCRTVCCLHAVFIEVSLEPFR